jgi:hypothetical protein
VGDFGLLVEDFGMNLIIIDDIAWIIIRVVALFQALLFEFIEKIWKPTKLSDQLDLMGRIYGAWYIFYTPREEMPAIIRDRLMTMGRFLLGFFVLIEFVSLLRIFIH